MPQSQNQIFTDPKKKAPRPDGVGGSAKRPYPLHPKQLSRRVHVTAALIAPQASLQVVHTDLPVALSLHSATPADNRTPRCGTCLSWMLQEFLERPVCKRTKPDTEAVRCLFVITASTYQLHAIKHYQWKYARVTKREAADSTRVLHYCGYATRIT
jgi:hypothetical protein